MLETLAKSYRVLASFCDKLQATFLLVLRLVVGVGFLSKGWEKLANLEKTSHQLDDYDLSHAMVWAVVLALTELIGGGLLVLGAGARLVAVPLTVAMSCAYYFAHPRTFENIIDEPGEFLQAPPFLFLLAAVIILIFGPGQMSVDAAIDASLRRREKERRAQAKAAEKKKSDTRRMKTR